MYRVTVYTDKPGDWQQSSFKRLDPALDYIQSLKETMPWHARFHLELLTHKPNTGFSVVEQVVPGILGSFSMMVPVISMMWAYGSEHYVPG